MASGESDPRPVADFRSAGSLSEWLRQKIITVPGIRLEDLVASAAEAPRSWRIRRGDPDAVALAALRRLARRGEAEIVDGCVHPTRRMRRSYPALTRHFGMSVNRMPVCNGV